MFKSVLGFFMYYFSFPAVRVCHSITTSVRHKNSCFPLFAFVLEDPSNYTKIISIRPEQISEKPLAKERNRASLKLKYACKQQLTETLCICG